MKPVPHASGSIDQVSRLNELKNKAKEREREILLQLIAAWILEVRHPFEIVRELKGSNCYLCYLRPTDQESKVGVESAIAVVNSALGVSIDRKALHEYASKYRLMAIGRRPAFSAIQMQWIDEAMLSVNLLNHKPAPLPVKENPDGAIEVEPIR
ncbi:MAG TPA: hypothetical protein V6D07_18785 [Trichocoleus sp.]